MTKILHRPMQDKDRNFVLNSFLCSYRKSPTAVNIRNKEYYSLHGRLVNAVLQVETTKVLLACNPEDPDQIYGYLIYDDSNLVKTVFYCYVKLPFRRQKIARGLLQEAKFDLDDGFVYYNHTKVLDKFESTVKRVMVHLPAFAGFIYSPELAEKFESEK